MAHHRPKIDHELLLAQSAWVQGLARNLVRDPGGAEDVAQDTMLAALASPPTRMDDERSLRAWLARVVTNLAHLATRRSARRRRREEQVAHPERVSSAAETVERAGQLRLVVATALELDEPYRSTVLLRYFDGLPTDEIAERQGISQVAVRKRLSRGVERLRRRLDDEHQGDRRAWMAAMLPFALQGAGGAPRFPWWATVRVTVAALAAATLAGLSALVALGLRAGAPAPAATPPTSQVVQPVAAEPRQPVKDLVLWDLPYQPYQEAERARLAPVEPGRRVEPETPRPPAAAPPGERTARGRVVDLDGRGLPGLMLMAAGEPERALGTSGPGGRFEVLLPEGASHLRAGGGGFATLRESPFGVGALGLEREHVVVAERAHELAGWVEDPLGIPLEGAELRVEVTDEAWLELSVPIERSRLVARAAVTDGMGAWNLEGLVAHEGLFLRTRLEGFEDDVRPVRDLVRGAVGIRLRPLPTVARARFQGRVVYPGGRPAAGAVVRAGTRTVRADRAGRFVLGYDPTRPPKEIVADVDGWQPAVELFPPEIPGENDPGPFRELRLAGEVLTIEGLLNGPLGEALAGWIVLASDEQGDPRYPELPPGAPVRRTRTGGDGSFVLEGLLDRPYTLRAYDPTSMGSAQPTSVRAGLWGVRLAVAASADGPLDGRVTRRDGAPLPFALVAALAPSGGGTQVQGPWVVADGAGRFQLPPGGGRQPAALAVQHGTVAFAVAAPVVGGIQVPRDAWFRFAGGSFMLPPNNLEVLDGEGKALLLHGPGGSGTGMRLHQGRSAVLRTTEDARTLVLRQGRAEVARLALQLVAGEITVVGGGASGGASAVGPP